MFNLVFKIPGSSKIMARHGARTSCRARRRVKSIENRMGRQEIYGETEGIPKCNSKIKKIHHVGPGAR